MISMNLETYLSRLGIYLKVKFFCARFYKDPCKDLKCAVDCIRKFPWLAQGLLILSVWMDRNSMYNLA